MSAKFWHRLSSECALWEKGTSLVAGADEAGCGPLAGPVVAAAVVFPCSWLGAGLYRKLRGLNDSEQLTEEKREKFYSIITTHPDIRYAIATVDVEMIDRINIRQAAWRAMNIALDHFDINRCDCVADLRMCRDDGIKLFALFLGELLGIIQAAKFSIKPRPKP